MEEKYTQQTLNEFFEEFKNLPYSFKIEQVHQLLNNPYAKATHKVNSYYKHLKLIIMTSALIIGITTILIWFVPKSSNTDVSIESLSKDSIEIIQYGVSPNIKAIKKQKNTISNNLNTNEDKNIPEKISHNTLSNNTTFNTNGFEPKEEENSSYGQVPYSDSNIINNVVNGINLIELKKSEYVNLGFLINDSTIYHFSRNSECVWKIQFTKNEYGCEIVSFNMTDSTKPNFIFLSNNNGFQSVKWRCGNDIGEKWSDVYFKTKIQELIPIVLRKSDFPDLLHNEDQIFWFEPSVELFNNLPPRISNDLKNEYYNIISNRENLNITEISASSLKKPVNDYSNNCNYFEACKSNINIKSMNIYPIPASYSITIEFDANEELFGSISLVNISGIKLKTLVPNSLFSTGINSYNINLSGITPGIYLISINTDKGFKTQRLIVSQ